MLEDVGPWGVVAMFQGGAQVVQLEEPETCRLGGLRRGTGVGPMTLGSHVVMRHATPSVVLAQARFRDLNTYISAA